MSSVCAALGAGRHRGVQLAVALRRRRAGGDELLGALVGQPLRTVDELRGTVRGGGEAADELAGAVRRVLEAVARGARTGGELAEPSFAAPVPSASWPEPSLS